MKKKMLISVWTAVILSLALYSGNCAAQSNATVGEVLKDFGDNVLTHTKWDFVPYVIYTPKLEEHVGYGFGAFYNVNDYVLTGLRLEYLNGSVWMPNGTCTLKLPLHPLAFIGPAFAKISVTPFLYGGVGYPLSGLQIGSVKVPGKDNQADDVVGITGAGAAVVLYNSDESGWRIAVVSDVEKWTSIPDNEYRFGLDINKRF